MTDDTTDGLDPFVEQHLPKEPPEGRNDIGMFYLRYMLEHMDDFSNTVLKLAHGNSVPLNDAGEIVKKSEATRLVEITPPMERGGVPFFHVNHIYSEPPDDLQYGDIVMCREDGDIVRHICGIGTFKVSE